MIRDSKIGRALAAFTAVTWLVFAVLCAWLGNAVTSKQWVYLMSIPGGKWFWAGTFGIGSAVALYGIIKRCYRLTAIGLFVVGTCCFLIFAFYLLAPLIDPGLMTLGYVVWFFGTVPVYALAAVNVTPVSWF
jgi:hypothetical protein